MRERNVSIGGADGLAPLGCRGSRRRARDYVSSAPLGCRGCQTFYVRASLAGIEPVGFRVKSDLRNHQAIVQPRLYDSLMVTQITLPVWILVTVLPLDFFLAKQF